jgi:hypothetical protein
MEWLMGAGALGFALTSVVLAIRNGGLRVEITKADKARHDVEKQFSETAKEFVEYKRRTEDRFKALKHEIEELENELENAAIPGARRDRLNRLLSEEAPDSDDRNPQ